MIHYKCNKCGEDMESPDSLAGGTDQCPHCGAPNTVVGTLSGETEASPDCSTPNTVPARRRGVAVGLLGLIAMCGPSKLMTGDGVRAMVPTTVRSRLGMAK